MRLLPITFSVSGSGPRNIKAIFALFLLVSKFWTSADLETDKYSRITSRDTKFRTTFRDNMMDDNDKDLFKKIKATAIFYIIICFQLPVLRRAQSSRTKE